MPKKSPQKRRPPVVRAVATPAIKKKAGVASPADSLGPRPPTWTFLTNHAHAIILLSQEPSIILREVAVRIGITERAVQRIIAELEEAGYIEKHKLGRQNHYRILASQPLRHPIENHRTIGDLLDLIRKGR
ncbi:MAG: winged helix-turn-helix transcriptional regulator [Planctomycetaceae bacterium]|nr:winged helix-turn-helix transcriptional regulator [Planctomycetaceae bacterium]